MKLIVGLGNPGRKYDGTRHNVGFEVIGELARRYDAGRPKAKFNGELAETRIRNQKSVLLCPLTFMNNSGQCVKAVIDFYKLSLDDVLIITDDMNLALARLKLKPSGSAGGQNGLKDIIRRVGDQKIPRLRIGIDRPPPGWDSSNYVLGKFSGEDRVAIDRTVKRAADAVEVWVAEGMSEAMNRFNIDPNKKPKQKQDKSEKQQDPEASPKTGGPSEKRRTELKSEEQN